MRSRRVIWLWMANPKARAIFLVNVPIAVEMVIGALLYLPSDQERGSRRIDLASIATLSSSLLLVLLGLGGLGLGTGFNTLIGHLTNAVPSGYAPDISGASTTLQIGGAIGVAAFGSVYLGLAPHAGAAGATDAFAITTVALAGTTLITAASAHLANRVSTAVGRDAD